MQPNLATRLGPGRAIATSLGLTLVLGYALVPRSDVPLGDIAPAPHACPKSDPPPRVRTQTVAMPVAPVIPDANAADLVGIYHSKRCTLTLDAAGTSVSDCDGHRVARYTTSGDHVVIGEQSLLISGRGRLTAADGTLFSIKERAR